MDLLPLFHWFEATTIGTVVRESKWMFPVIECIHLLALALLGGSVLVVDLSSLGLGLKSLPLPDLARRAHPWMAASAFTLIATGTTMFLSEAIKCFYSPPFWYKMGLLLTAMIFAFTVRRRVLTRDRRPAMVRFTALTSMALWFGVAFSGRWIAFY